MGSVLDRAVWPLALAELNHYVNYVLEHDIKLPLQCLLFTQLTQNDKEQKNKSTRRLLFLLFSSFFVHKFSTVLG